MLKSTERGLTEPCPKGHAPAGEPCYRGGSIICARRRALFFIDSGKKKTARELERTT